MMKIRIQRGSMNRGYFNKKVAVLIPVYKKIPNKQDAILLNQVTEKFPNIDKYLVMPKHLEADAYQTWGFQIVRMADKFFKSERTYTKLLLQKNFYTKFIAYEYILIVQLDVWLLKGEEALAKFLQMEWDYIGAPWFGGNEIYQFTFHGIGRMPIWLKKPHICYVGNGGLSLRRVQSCLNLLEEYHWQSMLWRRAGEDTFFAYYGEKDKKFKMPDVSVAKQFALEQEAESELRQGNVPIGIHAWKTYCPCIAE